MAWPVPVPGLVIRHAYLWRREYTGGRQEANKDRPCAVVMAVPTDEGGTRVYVLPVTHSAPRDLTTALEIPPRIKRDLGLDGERSWIIVDEINDFLWPGYDIRPVPSGSAAGGAYGMLPPRFFDLVRGAFVKLARQGGVKRVPRD